MGSDLKITKQKISLAVDLFFILGFSFFLFWLLGQSVDTCNGAFFCIGKPDIFNHSLVYDLVFLRAGAQQSGSHWFSEILIPILFFFTMFYTKNVKFGFIQAAFLTFWHEFVWLIPITLYRWQFIGSSFDSPELILLGTSNIVAFWLFRKIYFTKAFALLNIPYVLYLGYWYFAAHMEITVVYTTPTPYYYNFLPNALETGGWFIVFCMIVANTVIIKYRHVFIRIQ
jgi:hypothetical protein